MLNPDSSLNLEMSELEIILTAYSSGTISQHAHTVAPTSKLVQVIAQSLAGRTFPSPSTLVLALVAGGAVLGLNLNEKQPVQSDLGHSIYILPGSIESPTRRIREVVERKPSAHIYLPHQWNKPLTEIVELRIFMEMFILHSKLAYQATPLRLEAI